jgi:hypothetical protein
VERCHGGQWNAAAPHHPDGESAGRNARGTVKSPDGTGVEIPIAITEKGNSVVVSVPSIGISFAGELDTTAGQITGTWQQAGMAVPLTLRRDKE